MVVLGLQGSSHETLQEVRRQSINEADQRRQRGPFRAFCGHSLAGIAAWTAVLQLGGRRCAIARSASRRPVAARRSQRRAARSAPRRRQKDGSTEKVVVQHKEPMVSMQGQDLLVGSKTPAENALELLSGEPGGSLSAEDAAFTAAGTAECQSMGSRLGAFDAALRELTLKQCMQDVQVWQHSCSQHPLLQLVLLHQVGLKGGHKAWSALGISDDSVLDTVGQVAVLIDGQHLASSKKLEEFDLRPAARSVLRVLGEERIASSAHAMTASQALALHGHFAEALPSSALLPLLEAALADAATAPLVEEHVLSLALALEADGLAEKCVWEKFALLLTRCWSSLDNRSLLAAMLVLPELLRAAPGDLESALVPLCETNLLSSLPYGCVVWLLDSWASCAKGKRFPSLLARLLRPAVERHLLDFDVRRLIAASHILDTCDGDGVVDILLFWQSWMEHLVSECKVKTWRWSRCQEALREVAQSSTLRETQTPSLGDMIMEGILLTDLVRAKEDLPLELLLDVGRRLPKEARGELQGALQELLWHCLAGRGGGLSLLNAVSVAQGETFLPCEPGSKLFDALVDHIVKVLRKTSSASSVSFFCRCRPSPALRQAVLTKLRGWQRLELSVC
mmetsp:Transcript_30069/g.71544  ORF Transcript_30069/g.71544 Transcript_30069/m.71544 type:complete len:623 (+) Transcript_30069:53-1921(+)